jgi:hypothetical protein
LSTKTVEKMVATPSKMELAIHHLKQHRPDRKKSGRELAESVFPMGVEISHKTWNDAKSKVG